MLKSVLVLITAINNNTFDKAKNTDFLTNKKHNNNNRVNHTLCPVGFGLNRLRAITSEWGTTK